MSEWIKTLLYVGVALATIALAMAAEWMARPVSSGRFEQVGQEFYPDFDNPVAARTLDVFSYDPDQSVIHEFHVDWGEQGWSISPYGYPADAEDTLEKTAASVVGIERTGLASRRASDHERFGVVDPRGSPDVTLEGRGKRITLADADGQTLVDLIIGDAVEGREGYYYVRKPKEDDTYIAKVNLDLSTKFADWIESDLLKVSASDLQTIEILNYSLDQASGRADMRGRSVLTKQENMGPWTLKGLDQSTKQLNTSAVNQVTQVLDQLKIIGVRPKPEGLRPDLTFDPEVINNQIALQVLQQKLADKGFYLGRDQEDNMVIIGKEGQLIATTSDGIAYELYFGEQFSGSRYEIEFGASDEGEAPETLKTSASASPSEKKTTDAGDEASEETPSVEGESDSSETPQTGRYVFITARYVPEAAGDPPTAPEPAPGDATEEEKKAAEQALMSYEQAKKAHEAKGADAKEKVEELNQRFKNWFYVISTENFEDLRLSREALVEPKEKESESAAPSGQLPPGTMPPSGGPPQAKTPSAKEAAPKDTPAKKPESAVTAPKPAAE